MNYIKDQLSISKILERSSFLSNFSFDVIPYLKIAVYQKGEYIIHDSEQLTRILYLERGTAKLYGIHKNGKQSLINFFKAPSFFGVPELFEVNKRPFPIIAHSECLFIELETTGCRSKLLGDAAFLYFCCSFALNQNVSQNHRYLSLTANPGKNNLAAAILLLQSNGFLNLKYIELAEYLTISYRRLMQLIAEMCKKGIIKRCSKGICILDIKRLQDLASETREY